MTEAATIGGEPVIWRPSPKQAQFLSCTAYEALYGGSAGGGKTEALTLGALRWVHRPGYRALILRRTFPELNRDIVPLAYEYYPCAGGRYNVGDKMWKFPSGAVIEFGHVEGEMDVHKFQGLEAQYLAFDELTSFTELQYTYLLSRVRSSKGVPVRVRAATNPGGVGHDWVFKRWGAWLDKESPVRAEPREVLWYRNVDDEGEVFGERGPDSLSRVFFPARVQDNPHMMTHDPQYLTRLSGLDAVTRARLRDGDWLAQPRAGMYYRRSFFEFLDVRPGRVVNRVRSWDLASTENGGDWTVGVLMALLPDRRVVIEDVVRVRQRPAGVEATVMATAQMDGHAVHIRFAQDPGQAGKSQVAAFTRMLSGYVVKSAPETGDKVTRQQPLSAQAEAGNVAIVKAPWNEAFVSALESFPDPKVHDDDVDAAAGAYLYLCGTLPNLNYIKAVNTMAKEARR